MKEPQADNFYSIPFKVKNSPSLNAYCLIGRLHNDMLRFATTCIIVTSKEHYKLLHI
jgi:hypothetical protein